MKGYQCDLKNDELVSLRDQFWKHLDSLDPGNKKLLKVMRQSCLMEPGKKINNDRAREKLLN